MALSGDLTDFSIPDVFRLISLSGKTGVLHLTAPGAEGSVWFRDGQVFFAQSDRRRGLLGERLVSAGRVSAQALARALAIRGEEPAGGRRIGEILVDEGIITLPVLQGFVQEQIQDTVFDLFLWDAGTFEFELLDAPPEDQDIGLAVSIENIVMEGARRLDEWTKLRTSASSGSVVFRVGSISGENVVDIALKPSEWRVVTLADGTRTVAQVAEAAGVPEFEASRTLYGLFGAGLLQMVDSAEQPAPAVVPSAAPPEPVAPAPIVLESDVVLAFEPDAPEPSVVPSVSPESPESPVPPVPPAPQPVAAPSPAFEPGLADYDRDADLEESLPPVGLVYGLSDRTVPDDRASVTRTNAQRGLWAGMGSEVAALTGADSRPARFASTKPAQDETPHGHRRIRWDSSITREDLVRIHAGIKEL